MIDIFISKNNLLQKLIFILIILALIITVKLVITKIYSRWKENNTVIIQKENKKKIIETFLENKDFFDNFINYVYSKNEKIEVNFTNEKIDFLIINGNNEFQNEEYNNLFNKLYTILKCERVRLYKNSSGSKVLEIFSQDGGVYDEFIIYSKDKIEELTDEISPGWYYKTLWYT